MLRRQRDDESKKAFKFTRHGPGIVGVSVMPYMSRTSEPSDVKVSWKNFFYRIFAINLVALCPQLVGLHVACASELIELAEDSAVQVAAEYQQFTQTGSVEKQEEESLSTYIQNEVHCLALNIYFEARSEPDSGQRAVGHVVMNRVSHSRYPDSVCKVVQQGGEKKLHRCQFSWWCDGRSDRPVNRKAWEKSLQLARKIYLGILKDTTGGALWYHATYVKPYWSDILLKGDKIGQHVFYLENRRTRETM